MAPVTEVGGIRQLNWVTGQEERGLRDLYLVLARRFNNVIVYWPRSVLARYLYLVRWL